MDRAVTDVNTPEPVYYIISLYHELIFDKFSTIKTENINKYLFIFCLVCYAKAIYDYDAMEDEELSFKEGDVIMVTSREVDDDDGWWEGVLKDKQGVFPSIVVEEMSGSS